MKRYMAVLPAIIILLAASIAISTMPAKPAEASNQTYLEKSMELVNRARGWERPLYFSSWELQGRIFSELPEEPGDLMARILEYRLNMPSMVPFDPAAYNETYWKQPEWRSAWAEKSLPMHRGFEGGRTAIWSTVTYPLFMERAYRIEDPCAEECGEYFETEEHVWVESVTLMTQHMGIRIIPVFPEELTIRAGMLNAEYGTGIADMSASQDPELTRKYITVEIEPNQLLLEPNYPVYRYGYRQMVTVRLRIRKDIPEGFYPVGFRIVEPSWEFTKQQLRKFGIGYYTDPNTGEYSIMRDYDWGAIIEIRGEQQ